MKDNDRNGEPLDTILRRAMRAQPGPATPECADATSLAAYSDRSLAAAERERLETHFADCMRCQLVLADIARADESARDARATAEVPWYRRWRIAIPALATVAAIVVFIAIRRPANEEPRSDEAVAMAKRESPALEPAAPAPAAAPEMPEVASAPAPAAPAPPPAPPASNEIAMNEAKAPAPAAPRAEAMGAFSSQTLHRQATAPAMSALAAAPGAGAGAAIGGEALVTIFPPDRSVMWIIGKNGMVQRRDADGTMRVQHSGVSTDLVAGASPSAKVCWIVGHSGTIIRTTDGEHWERIGAPTTENLTAVSARSAHDVAITTARGQSFTTSDGGVTWHQQ